ncbi:unnamed protein product, partial [Notodromas monacha]
TGKFLALDLGGTNFRVLLIELGPNKFSMESKIFAVPQKVMLGSGEGLFDHIVDCLSLFTKEHGVADLKLPLGFTFSFPCSQEGLTKARLVTWTKGFKCSGVEGEDVVRLLREAISRRGDVDLDVLAVLNDTTGCLMSCAWKNPTAEIGVIVGTGTNACYMERLENVLRYPDDERADGPDQVVVNTEWGAFGDHNELDFVRTKYDHLIDEQSLNPGRQFLSVLSSNYPCGIGASVREDERIILEEELGLDNVTDDDCENVRYVCEVVSRRAAHLVSAGIATLLNKIQKKKVTVAVDGSVYRFHPHFHNLMMDKIKQLLHPGLEFKERGAEKSMLFYFSGMYMGEIARLVLVDLTHNGLLFSGQSSPLLEEKGRFYTKYISEIETQKENEFALMLSEDGSGRGAALVAAVASRVQLAKLNAS